MFIVFEGCDGTGKTTHSTNLTNKLFKLLEKKPFLIRFPDRETQTGKLINNHLSLKEKINNPRVSHLLFSANRWEKANKINECLKENRWVISDRYYYLLLFRNSIHSRFKSNYFYELA